MCRFCKVEVLKVHEATHLAGKKHCKLAGNRPPDACWEYVEKVGDRDAGEPAPSAADAAAALREASGDAGVDNDGGGEWETVATAARKKDARAAAAKRRAAAAAAAAEVAAAEQAAQRAPLRVHRRCDECGIRVRDGATIETDPDNENRAYCTECWERWRNPPPPAEDEAPAPKPHVTKWNRDD